MITFFCSRYSKLTQGGLFQMIWFMLYCLLYGQTIYGQSTTPSPNTALQYVLPRDTALQRSVAVPVLRVQRLNDATFGTVLGDIGKTLPYTDANAVRFAISAPAFADIVLSFALPPVVMNAMGRRMSLLFAPNSAAWSPHNIAAQATVFNPAQPLRLKMPSSGIIFIWVGASVPAAKGIASGRYQARIELVAALQSTRP